MGECPPYPVEFTVSQHAQQSGLGFRRHVADLVEKQGAAVRLFEATLATAVGAGECTLLVSEQFGFDQFPGNRCHVERDECTAGARTVPMQGSRHQLLAGAGCAADQHGDVRVCKPADRTEHFLHCRCFADDLLGGLLEFRFMCRGMRFFVGGNRALYDCDCIVHIEWFGQIFEGAALIGADRAVQIRMSGHDDHGQLGIGLVNVADEVETVGARHTDIGDHCARSFVVQMMHRIVGRVEGLDTDTRLGHGTLQHPSYRAVVIDDPHGVSHPVRCPRA